MNWKTILAGTLLALGLSGCMTDKPEDGPAPRLKPYEVGEKIVLQNVHGGSKTLVRTEKGFVVEGEEHKVVMVDIFGTFCQPCKEEAPHLTDLQLRRNGEFVIIGLTHLEEVSDDYVRENFTGRYNAYYFIANGKENARIAQSVTDDIGYKSALQVPFKVMLKDGKYQHITDVWEKKPDNLYYIGKIDTAVIEQDLNKILEQ
ncbi:MAG: TlpA family protein disulfide reductase [Campylobacterales bacterium]|nr:TlpA family protein disulfide reductase [Campylobacterales bacterium]